MSKRGSFGVGTGGASILVIFVLLCLTTFATLSIVSANADYKLTRRSAEAVADYYAADLRASELLARLDAASRENPEATAEDLVAVLAAEEDVTATVTGGGSSVAYTVPVGDTRELRVVLNMGGQPGGWSVAAWQTASTVEWEESSSIQLWDGGPGGSGTSALPESLAGSPASMAE